MKWYIASLLYAAIMMVECHNTFIGTNVQRPLVGHHYVEYSSKMFRKRVENLYFMMPEEPENTGRVIQGILAIDQTNSGASATITEGGIGYNFVNLRMKSDHEMKIKFDVYIYA